MENAKVFHNKTRYNGVFSLHRQVLLLKNARTERFAQHMRFIQRFPKQELADRIYRYFEEVNAEPIIFHWKYKLDDIDISEEPSVETLPFKKSS